MHLGSRAAGGVRPAFVEATAVTPEGRIAPRAWASGAMRTSNPWPASPDSLIRKAPWPTINGPMPVARHAATFRGGGGARLPVEAGVFDGELLLTLCAGVVTQPTSTYGSPTTQDTRPLALTPPKLHRTTCCSCSRQTARTSQTTLAPTPRLQLVRMLKPIQRSLRHSPLENCSDGRHADSSSSARDRRSFPLPYRIQTRFDETPTLD